MPADPPEIVRCPPQRIAEALSFVLCELAPSQRGEIAGPLLKLEDAAELANEPLYIALRGERMCGVAWGQRQSGNIAVFWPPWLASNETLDTGRILAESVMESLDSIQVEMTQVLLSEADSDVAQILRHVDFRHLADLLYLSCESARFPQSRPASPLEFVPYDGSQHARMTKLIERTYVRTLDCVGLNGVRDVDNVLNGYQATGVYRPENWNFVRIGNEDIGLLLMANHPASRHWELMYMGLVPEARGKQWGQHITRYAQWLAGSAEAERVVLAVDTSNTPALAMYRSTGFEAWDKRSVYLRFPAARRGSHAPGA